MHSRGPQEPGTTARCPAKLCTSKMGSHVAPGCTWGKPPCQSGPIIAHRIAHSCTAAAQSAHPSALPTPARLQRAGANPKAHHASPRKGSSGRPSRRLSRARHAQRGGAQRCSSLGRRADAPWPCPGGMQQAGSRWCALGSVWGFWQPAVTAAALPPPCRRCRLLQPVRERLLCASLVRPTTVLLHTPHQSRRLPAVGKRGSSSSGAAAASQPQPRLGSGDPAATGPCHPGTAAAAGHPAAARAAVGRQCAAKAEEVCAASTWARRVEMLGLCDHSRCPTRVLFCLSALSPRESMLWLIALIAPPLTPNPLRRAGP